MKKLLQIAYPTITSYPGRANFYAITETDNRIFPWLMERYIQTESLFNPNTLECDIDFFLPPQFQYSSHTALESQNTFCPLVENYSFFIDFIDYDAIIDYIIKSIDNGYYVTLFVNTQYISVYKSGSAILHNIFIYGYDTDKQILYIADFFISYKYSFQNCTFCELINSIKHYNDLLYLYDNSYCNKSILSLIKIKDNVNHIFSVKTFNKNLREYLGLDNNYKKIYNLTNTYNTHENKYRAFGNLHYNNLIDYLTLCKEKNIRINNHRVFHIFFDHKTALLQRLNFINKNLFSCCNTIENFNNIVKEAQLIRNIILKHSFTGNMSVLSELITKLSLMKISEQDILYPIEERLGNLNT